MSMDLPTDSGKKAQIFKKQPTSSIREASKLIRVQYREITRTTRRVRNSSFKVQGVIKHAPNPISRIRSLSGSSRILLRSRSITKVKIKPKQAEKVYNSFCGCTVKFWCTMSQNKKEA